MDKNDDIQVNKISKWDAAPKDMGELFTYIDMVIGIACCLPHEIHDNLYDLMDRTLDDYNELEAKYQEACGMISQYEEENKNLKNKLDIMTDENDCLITRVFKQDEEYTKLEAEHKKLQETHELCMKAHLRLCDDSTKLAAENDDLRQERDKYSYRLEKLGQALEERGIHCRWFEVSLEWHLYEGESFEELNRKIQRLEKENKGLKKHYEEELRIREKEKDEKDKLIDELKKENKELKDTIEKDGEFGRNIGKYVADSIREGCDKGAYELHPYTRIDTHVEETNNMPTIFDRHAIPRIAVMFNNTQTEMERDTAQHECEELDKKVDRFWSVNEELNRKIKELKKENKELKATLKNLCNGIVSKVKRTRNNKEEK